MVRLGVDVPDWIILTNIFSSTSPPFGMVPRFHVRLLFRTVVGYGSLVCTGSFVL